MPELLLLQKESALNQRSLSYEPIKAWEGGLGVGSRSSFDAATADGRNNYDTMLVGATTAPAAVTASTTATAPAPPAAAAAAAAGNATSDSNSNLLPLLLLIILLHLQLLQGTTATQI